MFGGLSDCSGKNNESSVVIYKSNPSSLICSENGSFILNGDRNLISFGKNEKGYLGHEEIDEIIIPPKQIPNLVNIKMVDCGAKHTVCIDYEGKLFSFGDNFYCQLGIGKDKDELPFTHIPQHIIDIPPIDFISCGYNFTTCITTERSMYSFGINYDGNLGIGNDELYLSPQLIPDLYDVEFIECGGNHTICKTYSNEFYSWGYNKYGQLGQGDNHESRSRPIKCTNWPEYIIDIKCGSYHSLLLTSNGYVYSFGENVSFQLGFIDNVENLNIPTLIKDIPLIKRIGCGNCYSMCIDINDSLWVFGNNNFGQLGIGNNESKPILYKTLSNIIDISSRGNHTFVKTSSNEIYAYGDNECSQIGIETKENHQLTPIQVFKDNEDIWAPNITRSKQKSARK